VAVIGVRELLVKPVFTGGGQAIAKQLGGFAAGAGRAAGQSMGTGVSKGFSETAQKLKTEVADLEKSMSKSAGQIATAKAKIASSSEAEAKAVGVVRVAELKLQEVRDKGNASASQVAAAEERLAEARRKADKATGGRIGAENALKQATEDLEAAQGRSATAASELEQELKKVGDQSADSDKKVGGLAGSMGKLAKAGALAVGAGVVAAGALIAKGVVDSMGIEQGVSKLEARLGLTKEQASVAGKAAGAVYAQNFGGSMEEVSAATEAVISSVKGMRNASQADVEDMTKRMLTLADTMEIDVARASQVAGQLITTGLAKDGVEAADLLTSALQKVPASVREDILDAADEYGPFFANIGIKGEEAFGILTAASAKGMFGIDKTGDALKEFGIRATDMSKASGAAYEALGLNQEAMSGKLLAGGDTAKQAFGDIIHGLQEMKDPVAQSQAALALFGTPLEDLSVTEIPNFLGSLDPMGDKFDSVAGASDRAMTALSDNAAAGFGSFKRQAEGALIKFVQENIMPAVGGFASFLANDVGPKVSGFLDLLSGAASILFQGDFKGGLMGIEEDHPLVNFLFNVREGFVNLWSGLTMGADVRSEFSGQLDGWVAVGADVRAAFDGIVTMLQNLGTWVVQNKDWLGALAVTVGTMVVGMKLWVGAIELWKTITATATAIQIGFNAAMTANPIGLIVVGIAALVAGLVWFFTQTELGQQIVTNVWGAIQSFIGGTVAWFQTYVLPTVQQIFAGVGAVFSWLYENIIQPVFAQISWAAQAAWSVLDYIFQIIGAVITKLVGPAFNWLWSSVIQPVFGFIGALISFWWNSTVKPIFDAIAWVLNNVLGPAFSWLYTNVIKPNFDSIGAAISWVWLNVIKPVFDALSDFVTKTIPKAFEDGVSFIKTAWDKLQEIAKAPVRFVVNTVLNDGLIGGLNNIGGFLGLKPLPRVALPPGFADGGYTGPGGKNQPAGIVHAGEVVFSQEDIKRHGGVGAVEALRRGVGYAMGGIVAPLKNLAVTQGYNRVHKGIDYAAGVGTPVYATQDGVVSHAGPGARAPGVWGGNEVHVLGNGIETWFAHLSQIGVRLGETVRAGQQVAASGNTGISSGPHLHFGVFNGGWPNDIDPNAYLGGAGVPDGKPWNPIAGIVEGLMSSFKNAFPAAGFIADVAIGMGKKLLDGAVDFVSGNRSGDKSVSGSAAGPSYLYDSGGILPPGISQVMNRTGKPEAILNPQQWADISRLAIEGGNGMTYSPTYQWAGDDPHEVMAKDKARMRDTFNAFL
jgi:murein DD-endopeptidase MepM/ murein hydrolase activator NlpD